MATTSSHIHSTLSSDSALSKPKKSRVSSKVVSREGSAVWTIEGFSKLDDKFQFHLFSPEFQMAGLWWKMQLFPSGGGRDSTASSEGHASLYLFATRAPVKAKYSLALLHPIPVSTTIQTTTPGLAAGTAGAGMPPPPGAALGPGAIPAPVPLGAIPALALPSAAGAAALLGAMVPADAGTAPPPGTAEAATDGHITSNTNSNNENEEDKEKVYYICHGSTKTFGSPAEGWGFLKFFPRKQLMAGHWATRDEIRLQASVNVVTEILHSSDECFFGTAHLSGFLKFQHQQELLLNSGVGADFNIIVSPGNDDKGAVIFKTHKIMLLSGSTYFRTILEASSEFQDASIQSAHSGMLRITNCKPAIFQQLLRFIYSGVCDIDKGHELVMVDSLSRLPEKIEHRKGSPAPTIVTGLDEPDENGSEKQIAIAQNKPETSPQPEISSQKDERIEDSLYDTDPSQLLDLIPLNITELERLKVKNSDSESRVNKVLYQEKSWYRKQHLITQKTSKISTEEEIIVDPISSNAFDLICAAERFGIADLRKACEEFLIDSMKSSNCLYRLYTADLINASSICERAIEFITHLPPTLKSQSLFIKQLGVLPRHLLIKLMEASPCKPPSIPEVGISKPPTPINGTAPPAIAAATTSTTAISASIVPTPDAAELTAPASLVPTATATPIATTTPDVLGPAPAVLSLPVLTLLTTLPAPPAALAPIVPTATAIPIVSEPTIPSASSVSSSSVSSSLVSSHPLLSSSSSSSSISSSSLISSSTSTSNHASSTGGGGGGGSALSTQAQASFLPSGFNTGTTRKRGQTVAFPPTGAVNSHHYATRSKSQRKS